MTDLIALPAFLDRLAIGCLRFDHASFSDTPLPSRTKAAKCFDPVTVADRAAEQAMRQLINAEYPDHGIDGEEFGTERADAEFVWVLDPIDGTRAFITGLPVWGTLIGLTRNGEPILGMMAQPFTGERFAGDGTRAWYSGPNGKDRHEDAAVRRDSARRRSSRRRPPCSTAPSARRYDRVETAVRLPRYGCDCYAYCMVAAGHADLVIEAGLQSYDIVALIPIIEGAGGRVTDWDGGSAAKGGRVVASGDPRLHDLVLAKLAG